MKTQIQNRSFAFTLHLLLSLTNKKQSAGTGLLHPFSLWSLFMAFLTAQPLYSQPSVNDVDKIFSWTSSAAPGCLCAVSQNGKLIMNKAYGLADMERNVPLTTSSVLDAASLRKQFIAAAILLLVEEGRLSLSDDVRKHMPQLPGYGRTITIDHLLTHTSGIRDWQPLLNLAGGDPDAMTMILRQRGLNFAPGEEWSYSNSGYVLLTDIVNRLSGMPFSQFAAKRLFEPLGMKSTTYVDDMTEVVKDRALAYGKVKDRWKLDVYLGNDRGGAGALFTTASDLVTWNEALATKRLGALVSTKLMEPARLNNGRTLNYTRGLTLEPYRENKMVSHSGGVAGYHSWSGRLPDQGLSIAVMCNSDAMSATAMANRIIDLYVPATSATVSESGPPPPIPADVLADVTGKAGLYFNEQTGAPLRLAVDRGRFRIADGPGLTMVSKDKFRRWGAFVEFMSQDKFGINFLSPDVFELETMEGKKWRYLRAKAVTPTAVDLQAFAGRYSSEELMAVFDLAVVNNGLVARVNNRPGLPYPLMAVHTDTFQFAGVFLQFVRDKAGRIVGLDYSNPLLRKIRFTRAEDLAAKLKR